MQRILSTYRYVHQPLAPALLSEMAQAGIQSIEIYCAPQHFSYRSQEAIREMAGSLGDYRLELHALHSPTERDLSPGRESGVPISICETERIRRLDAVDEIKRALEVAERAPFRYLVQHFGNGRQMADPRKMDAAFSSLEHLCVFAKHRGVTIALENTPDELGSPASLAQFIKETHLHDLRVCFDVGHAHMDGALESGFEAVRGHVATAHIHDNHGEKDEHLLPYEGSVDWDAAFGALATAAEAVSLVFELKDQAAGGPSLDQVRAVFDKIEKNVEGKRPRASKN